MVLDTCIQCTKRDEFVFQEMLDFLSLLVHLNSGNVKEILWNWLSIISVLLLILEEKSSNWC